jgi:hypothetical protein
MTRERLFTPHRDRTGASATPHERQIGPGNGLSARNPTASPPRHRRQSRLLCLPSGSKSEFIAQGAPIWRILVKLAAVQIWLRQYESMA